MELIIDIDEELKQKIDEGFTNQVIINKLWDATRNGTPLDKIRAEIEPTRKMYLDMNDIDWLNGCDYVLSVIDKYKAESE